VNRLPWIVFVTGLLLVPAASAQQLPLVSMAPAADGSQVYSLNLQVLLGMTLLAVLPALLMTTTAFTRVLIVLAILRQGLGTQQTPSNQILVGLSLFLSFFIMSPVFNQAWQEGLKPYLDEELAPQQAFERTTTPIRNFMLNQTREDDLALFAELAGAEPLADPAAVPFRLLLPAFVTSELKTAFQIGFMILIPFLIIDLVVASILIAMGMVMLSPLIISLPFKLMLFVLVDGWSLLMGTLAMSFAV
jgi:flagellar biosynthetic protein FliP